MIRWTYAASFIGGALLLGTFFVAVLAGLPQQTEEAITGVVTAIIPWWMGLCAILAIAAIVDAIVLARRRRLRDVAEGAFVVKLAAVPYFLVNFAALGSIGFILAILPGGILAAPLLMAFTYLVMLPSSAYGVAALIRMRRDRVITHGAFWPLLLAHGIFVLDIAASIITWVIARRRMRGIGLPPVVAQAPAAAWVAPPAVPHR